MRASRERSENAGSCSGPNGESAGGPGFAECDGCSEPIFSDDLTDMADGTWLCPECKGSFDAELIRCMGTCGLSWHRSEWSDGATVCDDCLGDRS